MPAVAVAGLRKRYGDQEALHGIDFSIETGEVFGLLGPNGAGKTTTVEILEGYRDHDGGEVQVLGIDPQRGTSAWRERIGVMLQSSSLYPNLTVRESLRVFGGYYSAPRGVDEVIEIVELGAKADARVRTLSGGQARRLDLGLALIGDPELIFLDEPTTGFDPGARRTAWQTIRNLRELGKTILLTTHYLDEAEQLADRVAVLRAGEIVREGTPAELTGGAVETEIRYRRDGSEVIERTRDPTRRLHELTSAAVERGEELDELEVKRPDARGRVLGADRRVKLFLHELRTEQMLFWRNREAAFFTFFLPIIFFLVFGSIYGNCAHLGDIRGAAFLEAGMIGYGVASTAFAGLAITMVIRRESGVLKRIRATPLPRRDVPRRRARVDVPHVPDRSSRCSSSSAACSSPCRSRAAVLAARRARDRRRVCFAALGLGLTGFVRSAEGSSAVVNIVYLPMAIISGHVLHAPALPDVPEGRSPTSCRSPTSRG